MSFSGKSGDEDDDMPLLRRASDFERHGQSDEDERELVWTRRDEEDEHKADVSFDEKDQERRHLLNMNIENKEKDPSDPKESKSNDPDASNVKNKVDPIEPGKSTPALGDQPRAPTNPSATPTSTNNAPTSRTNPTSAPNSTSDQISSIKPSSISLGTLPGASTAHPSGNTEDTSKDANVSTPAPSAASNSTSESSDPSAPNAKNTANTAGDATPSAQNTRKPKGGVALNFDMGSGEATKKPTAPPSLDRKGFSRSKGSKKAVQEGGEPVAETAETSKKSSWGISSLLGGKKKSDKEGEKNKEQGEGVDDAGDVGNTTKPNDPAAKDSNLPSGTSPSNTTAAPSDAIAKNASSPSAAPDASPQSTTSSTSVPANDPPGSVKPTNRAAAPASTTDPSDPAIPANPVAKSTTTPTASAKTANTANTASPVTAATPASTPTATTKANIPTNATAAPTPTDATDTNPSNTNGNRLPTTADFPAVTANMNVGVNANANSSGSANVAGTNSGIIALSAPSGSPAPANATSTTGTASTPYVRTALPNKVDPPKKSWNMPAWFGGKNRGTGADAASKQGGTKISPPATAEQGAVAIQKTWRGKSTRKLLWRQQVAAIDIQRIFRGMKEFKVFPSKLNLFKEKQEDKKARKERLARIAQKERDLALLSRVGPEQFGRFEELQNNANARTIQQAWRKKREFEYIHRGETHTRRGSVHFKNAEHAKKSGAEVRQSKESQAQTKEEKAYIEAKNKLFDRVKRTCDRYGASDEEKRAKPDFSHPDHALKLSFLHQRIRESAAQRMDNENKAYVQEGGVRRHYQALLHAQQHAHLLYQDYIHDYAELAEQQKSRYKSMNTCFARLDSLSKVPSLDVMTRVFNGTGDSSVGKNVDGVNEGLAEEKAAKEWLQSESFVLDRDKKPSSAHVQLFEKAIHNHLEAKQAVMDTTKWSSVYLPNFESSSTSHSPSQLPIQTHYLSGIGANKQSNFHMHKQFKHLAGDWVEGGEGDGSLQWVTYACQKSNILSQTHAAQASSSSNHTNNLPADHLNLLKQIYSAAYTPAQRKQKLDLAYAQEQQCIHSLTKQIYDEYAWRYRERLRVYGMAKRHSYSSTDEIKLKAVSMVQKYVRRWIARKRYIQMQQQQRVMGALHTLLVEISNAQPGSRHNHANAHPNGSVYDNILRSVVPNLIHPPPLNPMAVPTPLPPHPPTTHAYAQVGAQSPSIFRHTHAQSQSQSTLSMNISSTTKGSTLTHPFTNPHTHPSPTPTPATHPSPTPNPTPFLKNVAPPLNSQFSTRTHSHTQMLPSPVPPTHPTPMAHPSTDPFSRLSAPYTHSGGTPQVPESSMPAYSDVGITGAGPPVSARSQPAATSAISAATPIPTTTKSDRVRFSFDKDSKNTAAPASPAHAKQTSPRSTPAQTPTRTQSQPHTNTHTPSHADSSLLLSPFLGLHDEEEKDEHGVGYVSSPSQSHSLSRSLTASFGMVAGSGRMGSMYTVPGEGVVDILVEVEQRFKNNQCDAQSLVISSMQADMRNFKKTVAFDALGCLVDHIGAKPLLSYVQRFASKKNLEVTLSADSMEMDGVQVAMLCCEILSLLYTNDRRVCTEEEVHSLIQLCLLIRLLSDNPALRLTTLGATLEDIHIHRLPPAYVDIFLAIARIRVYIVRLASKKASNPVEVCTSVISQEVPGSSVMNVDTLAKVIQKLCPAAVYALDTLGASQQSSTQKAIVRIAQVIVDYLNWETNSHETSVKTVLTFLCSLPSFRNLQKKLAGWFASMPALLDDVLACFPSGQASLTEFTLKVTQQTFLPLCMPEAHLLAHLLARKINLSVGGSLDSQGEEDSVVVEVGLLRKIAVGEMLQAAL